MSNPVINLLKKAVGLPTAQSSSCCSVPVAQPEPAPKSSCCGSQPAKTEKQ